MRHHLAVPEAGHRLELNREVRPGGTPTALFLAHVLERGLEQVVTDGWATTARSLGALEHPSTESPARERKRSSLREKRLWS
jgi:hypothetical protein